MRYLKIKDLKNRKRFYTLEKLKLIQKFTLVNLINKLSQNTQLKLKKTIKIKNFLFLFYLNRVKYLRLTSKTRLLRRCLITGRNRSVLRSFNLSRIVLRDFIQFGILPGYQKSVW